MSCFGKSSINSAGALNLICTISLLDEIRNEVGLMSMVKGGDGELELVRKLATVSGVYI
jgi:hypothetical protein